MTFPFYTFGGSQFWEDVFFYQKWRIQRNYESKKYRLLDPWDIVRHKGSFEDCRKAFVQFIDVYQLPRQKGPVVIMLHGLADSKNIFNPLAEELQKRHYVTAAINYPSTEKRIDGHVKQIEFLLNNMEDVDTVYFVTKGIGGIILRKLLAKKGPWQERIEVKRIVQVCPPNQGSAFITYLGRFKFLRWALGPITEEMSVKKMHYLPNLPENIESGIIYCQRVAQKFSRFFPAGLKSVMPIKDEVRLSGVKSIVEIKNSNYNIFRNRKVVCAIINFIESGKFK